MLKKLHIVAFVPLLFLTGCLKKTIRPNDLLKVKLGMSKESVIKALGEPTIYRGSMINNFSQHIDVYEYEVQYDPTASDISKTFWLAFMGCSFLTPFVVQEKLEAYWFFFCNDFLAKWCHAGDWETSQHKIKEIRFR